METLPFGNERETLICAPSEKLSNQNQKTRSSGLIKSMHAIYPSTCNNMNPATSASPYTYFSRSTIYHPQLRGQLRAQGNKVRAQISTSIRHPSEPELSVAVDTCTKIVVKHSVNHAASTGTYTTITTITI